MTLKELRISKGLTQLEAARMLNVSLRSYVSYENDNNKRDSLKYRFFFQEMEKINQIDEDHGVLQISQIEEITHKVFSEYKILYCYLFGSYAKGTASEKSDVDLLISGEISGIQFYELTEKLRELLHKKVDMLDVNQLVGNLALLNEVLAEGVKIYG
ncbi:MAG: nucleotidyltransferase domain-containing protein [Anaerolineaceae bacterium]|nr:nucleotidyltransferase domain-containing protein [Anaerolineaceae bacterium]